MTVYEFNKNPLERVRLEITTYEGRQYLNLRVWYDAGKNEHEDWRPTQKGLTLNVDLLPELKKAIDAACDKVEMS